MGKKTVFFSLLMLFACSERSPKDSQKENQILLKVGKEAEVSQLFKEYFELENIIHIQTTDEFLMADGIERVLFYKDKLVILDTQSAIWVIDYVTGKVDSYINRTGQGPGESMHIIDICLDEQTETIIAFNDYKNLLFFDLKGNFIRQEKCKKLYENVIYDNGSVLFYNPGVGYSCYPYHIEKFNLQEKTWDIIGKEKKLDFPMRLYGKHIIKSKRIWFGTPLDFDLNLFYNLKIESKYKLDPATVPLTKDEMKLATTDYDKFSAVRKTKIYGIGAIRETAHYLIFRSSKPGFFILNKDTNEIHWEDFVNESSLGIKLVNYFPHDGDDNRIMFLVYPVEWLNRKKNENDNISIAMRKIIDSIKVEEDSNPILVFYREK